MVSKHKCRHLDHDIKEVGETAYLDDHNRYGGYG